MFNLELKILAQKLPLVRVVGISNERGSPLKTEKVK